MITKLSFNKNKQSYEFDVKGEDKDYDHPMPYETVPTGAVDDNSTFDEANPYVGDEYATDEEKVNDKLDELGMHIDTKGESVLLDPEDELLARTEEDFRDDKFSFTKDNTWEWTFSKGFIIESFKFSFKDVDVGVGVGMDVGVGVGMDVDVGVDDDVDANVDVGAADDVANDDVADVANDVDANVDDANDVDANVDDANDVDANDDDDEWWKCWFITFL